MGGGGGVEGLVAVCDQEFSSCMCTEGLVAVCPGVELMHVPRGVVSSVPSGFSSFMCPGGLVAVCAQGVW